MSEAASAFITKNQATAEAPKRSNTGTIFAFVKPFACEGFARPPACAHRRSANLAERSPSCKWAQSKSMEQSNGTFKNGVLFTLAGLTLLFVVVTARAAQAAPADNDVTAETVMLWYHNNCDSFLLPPNITASSAGSKMPARVMFVPASDLLRVASGCGAAKRDIAAR
jgi:hypothetical protein